MVEPYHRAAAEPRKLGKPNTACDQLQTNLPYLSGLPPELMELIFVSARFTISAGSGA